MKLKEAKTVELGIGHWALKMTFDLGDGRVFYCYPRNHRHGFRQARKFVKRLRKLEQS